MKVRSIWTKSIVATALATVAFTTAEGAGRHQHGFAEKGNSCTMIPPNNQFHSVREGTGITEDMFNRILNAVEKVYAPIIEAKGAKLKVERRWDDDTVNAYAQQFGKVWQISMFGGLARHPEATPDGFAMVACHELGHHLGGAPKYNGMDWASTEGQSDYFATLKCMRKVMEATNNWEWVRRNYRAGDIDPVVGEKCKAGHGDDKQKFAMCVRNSMGGLALARLLADLGGSKMPQFDTPDQSKVSRTNQNHPAAQCRLDTYFAGSVCPVGHDIEVDDKDFNKGVCHPGSEIPKMGDRRQMRRFQLANAFGVRPACWYKDPGSKGIRMSPMASIN